MPLPRQCQEKSGFLSGFFEKEDACAAADRAGKEKNGQIAFARRFGGKSTDFAGGFDVIRSQALMRGFCPAEAAWQRTRGGREFARKMFAAQFAGLFGRLSCRMAALRRHAAAGNHPFRQFPCGQCAKGCRKGKSEGAAFRLPAAQDAFAANTSFCRRAYAHEAACAGRPATKMLAGRNQNV